MPTIDPPLIKGDRHSDYDYRDSLPVNFTVVLKDIKGDQGYLLSHDGLTHFADVDGVSRGGVYNERFNKHFRVSGTRFEHVSSDGAVSPIGDIGGSDTVSMANSFQTQATLANGDLYYYDNASFKKITDPDLGFPIDITWFRGVYVLTDGESLYHSSVGNEEDFSSLKYSSSEFAADPIKGVARNDQNQIIAFNRYSTEYFVFNPSAPIGTSVLQVISGKALKLGIVGTHCKAELDGNFFVLGSRKGESPSIHILGAGQSLNIATREVDKVISKYNEQELQSVVMESRVVDRDKLLLIHLPCETLVYNHTVGGTVGTENAWTYVKTGVDTDEPWRGIHGVYDPRNAKWIYGDKLDGRLGYLDQKTSGQYGDRVESICYTPILNLETASVDELELDTMPGYSMNDFVSFMSMSRDGVGYGKEYTTLISEPNNYTTRYIVRRLGYIGDTVNFKFRFASTDKMAFSGLRVEVS